ncbi:hypothetical protein ACLKA6_003118 [Drosophila palustris]
MLATPSGGTAPTNEKLNNGYLPQKTNALNDELNGATTIASPLLGQQQQQHAQQQHAQQQHNKLPTVVFLSADGSNVVAPCNNLQRQVATVAATTAVGSDWLLLKETQQRRRLFVLAIAFTVLGAAIGALAIYFASLHQHCQFYQHSELGDSGGYKTNQGAGEVGPRGGGGEEEEEEEEQEQVRTVFA